MVCMPGQPAYPVLAVCAPVPPIGTAGERFGTPSPLRDNSVNVVSSERDGKIAIQDLEQRQPQQKPNVATDEDPPTGFLLKWETPPASGENPTLSAAANDAEIGIDPARFAGDMAPASGGGTSRDAEAGRRVFDSRRLYGGGVGRCGQGEVKLPRFGRLFIYTALD